MFVGPLHTAHLVSPLISYQYAMQLETVYVLEGLGPPPADKSTAGSDGPTFADQVRSMKYLVQYCSIRLCCLCRITRMRTGVFPPCIF